MNSNFIKDFIIRFFIILPLVLIIALFPDILNVGGGGEYSIGKNLILPMAITSAIAFLFTIINDRNKR